MAPETKLILGLILISLPITYWLWAKTRVVLFAQHLCDIRDALFDRVRELGGGHDDPAYRACRATINAIIRNANRISVPVAICVWIYLDRLPRSENPESESPELQQAIDAAYSAMTERVLGFLLFHTIGGWMVLLLAAVAFIVNPPGHELIALAASSTSRPHCRSKSDTSTS